MSDNPYQATNVMGDMKVGGADPTLERAVTLLRQTKPWVRFISVITFIASAFMVLGGVFMMIGSLEGGLSGVPAAIGIVYVVMALLYIMPAIFLWNYANRIAVFVEERSTGTLAAALEAQKSFWKFVGILMLIVLVIYAAIFGIGIGVAVVSSM